MLTLTPLNPFTAPRFAHLTWSDAESGSGAEGPVAPWPALGAMLSDEPVGLAVGRVGADGVGRLVSLYVRPHDRRRGIGTQLLTGLEALFAARGCAVLDVRYALGVDGTPAFERTLQRCGWPVQGERLHIFTLDGQIMGAPWFQAAVLPASYVIAPWSTVTSDDRRALAASQARDRWIPDPLLPDRSEIDLHAATSLVLRCDGDVIGWPLTSPFNATTVRYRNLYVRASCNRVGSTFAALALLAEAVRRQVDVLGVRSVGRFEVSWQNRAFLRFLDRHCGTHLLSKTVMQRVVKRIGS